MLEFLFPPFPKGWDIRSEVTSIFSVSFSPYFLVIHLNILKITGNNKLPHLHLPHLVLYSIYVVSSAFDFFK